MFRASVVQNNKTLLLSFLFILTLFYLLEGLLNNLSTNKSGLYQIPTYEDNGIVRIVPQVPLNEKLFEDAEIKDFVTEAMHNTLSMSFDNYKHSMTTSAVQFFTTTGWESFSKGIENSGLYSEIFTNSEILEFYPTRAPFLEYSDKVDGYIRGEFVKGAYWVWRVKVKGQIIRKSLQTEDKAESEAERRRNQRRKVATIEFDLDLQRVPKGKGASAVKIIDSTNWLVGYE
ncbi:hypothetical protein F7Q91_03055 [Vibrio chagasii]|uniref:Uncharacterized protein n=1 Tax=Vibrio chagasii TaxID=170679 RepID=A0A7V7THZ5_9VIBR|nr:DotI/IcmL/TraM family protein [Vibrio chagasii]KAB0482400.1 hypothetical protein F7Q91_03055 [Vibrio chagasii]